MRIESILIRLFLAVLIGGVVGYERSSNNSAAGLRTHILVAVSTTIISLIQLSMVEDIAARVAENPDLYGLISVDYGRLGAQAIAGIGFIGAGTILHQRNTIVGLTTAASIWAVAVVGLALGMGYYAIALIGGVGIIMTLDTLRKFQRKYITQPYEIQLDIFYRPKENVIGDVHSYLTKHNIEIMKVDFIQLEEKAIEHHIKYYIRIPKNLNMDELKKGVLFSNSNITLVESYGL